MPAMPYSFLLPSCRPAGVARNSLRPKGLLNCPSSHIRESNFSLRTLWELHCLYFTNTLNSKCPYFTFNLRVYVYQPRDGLQEPIGTMSYLWEVVTTSLHIQDLVHIQENLERWRDDSVVKNTGCFLPSVSTRNAWTHTQAKHSYS